MLFWRKLVLYSNGKIFIEDSNVEKARGDVTGGSKKPGEVAVGIANHASWRRYWRLKETW